MSGQPPMEHWLRRADQHDLETVVRGGQLIQCVANRARALLALDHGEASAVASYWTGLGRGALYRASPNSRNLSGVSPQEKNGWKKLREFGEAD